MGRVFKILVKARLVNSLPQPVKHLAKSVLSSVRWMRHRFFQDPAVEFYSLRKNAINIQFYKLVQQQKDAGFEAWMVPYHTRSIPKIIWIFWAQGEENFPPIVRFCVEQWRQQHPDWTINVIDKKSAERFVNTTDLSDQLELRIYADALRVRLLAAFGGVWADSTVYPHIPLGSWLPFLASTGFFVFTDDGPDREVESWFIASAPGSALVKAWDKAFREHLVRTDRTHESYFHFYYVFQHAIRQSPELLAAWKVMPRVPAPPCFLLRSHLEGFTPEKAVHDALANGLPLSKLDWRMPVSPEVVEKTAERLAGESTCLGTGSSVGHTALKPRASP